MSITYEINEKFDGIEIRFTEKPSPTVLQRMKGLGFRWHPGKCVWYAKNNELRLAFAKSLTDEKTYEQMSLFNMDEVKTEPKAEPKKEPNKAVETPKAKTTTPKVTEIPKKAKTEPKKATPKAKKEDNNVIEFAKARPDVKVRMALDENATIEECIEKINKEKEVYRDSDSTFVLDSILEMCKVNPNFRNNFMRKEKTYEGAFQYFMNLARQGFAHTFNGVAYMDNNLALGFALDYYNMVD